MKVLNLPPGAYLVGDPAVLVGDDDWETIRELFKTLNAGGTFICPRVIYGQQAVVLIPTKKGQVWFDDSWSIPAQSGMIAVMPRELVTADVTALTKVVGKINDGRRTRYQRVGAIETVTTKHLIVTIKPHYFAVGEHEFDLELPQRG